MLIFPHLILHLNRSFFVVTIVFAYFSSLSTYSLQTSWSLSTCPSPYSLHSPSHYQFAHPHQPRYPPMLPVVLKSLCLLCFRSLCYHYCVFKVSFGLQLCYPSKGSMFLSLQQQCIHSHCLHTALSNVLVFVPFLVSIMFRQ